MPNQRPYLGGGQPCASDLALAPRAYLARAGCRLLKASAALLGPACLAATAGEQRPSWGANLA